MMDILVPCKGFTSGKSRLEPCMAVDERRDLCMRQLETTLRVAAQAVGKRRVHVVTKDPAATRIAMDMAIRCIEDPGAGLNQALEFARARLLRESLVKLMILPTDLPWLAVEALDAISGNPAEVVIASDARRAGTNVLVMHNMGLELPLSYGMGSFAAHVSAAQRRGLTVQVVDDRRLAFDLDEPDQYFRWRGLISPPAPGT